MLDTQPRRRGRPSYNDQSLPPEDELLMQILAFFANRGYEGTSLRELSRH